MPRVNSPPPSPPPPLPPPVCVSEMIFAKVLQLDKLRYSGCRPASYQWPNQRDQAVTGNAAVRSTRQNSSRETKHTGAKARTNWETQPYKNKGDSQASGKSDGARRSASMSSNSQVRSKSSSRREEADLSAILGGGNSVAGGNMNLTEGFEDALNGSSTSGGGDDADNDGEMFSFGSGNRSRGSGGVPSSMGNNLPDQRKRLEKTQVNSAIARLSESRGQKVKTKELDMSGMSENVKRKILKRQAEEQARIDEQLARHLIEEEQKVKEQAERDRVKTRLNAKLRAWSGHPDTNTLKNIRALLATLDSVLWEGARWKAVSMADLVQGAKVKKAYYKAIRIAHPDRHQTGSVEQQYIASWVLDMLKLSWEKFKSVEGL